MNQPDSEELMEGRPLSDEELEARLNVFIGLGEGGEPEPMPMTDAQLEILLRRTR